MLAECLARAEREELSVRTDNCPDSRDRLLPFSPNIGKREKVLRYNFTLALDSCLI